MLTYLISNRYYCQPSVFSSTCRSQIKNYKPNFKKIKLPKSLFTSFKLALPEELPKHSHCRDHEAKHRDADRNPQRSDQQWRH
jgi:hypothetical protein